MASSSNFPRNVALPDDAIQQDAKSLEEVWVTYSRYTNEGLIWGRPKGIPFGKFANHGEEQVAHLFPDGGCNYFVANIVLQEGWRLKLEGKFPHARYFSITVANDLGNGQLGNGKFLRDDQIEPDQGSFNPFRPGVNRNIASRKYTVYIVQMNPPENPQPNTIYVEDALIGKSLHVSLRHYVSDLGYDGTGVIPLNGSGNGLPIPTLTLIDGSKVSGSDLLSVLDVRKVTEASFPAGPWNNLVKNSPDPTNAPAIPAPKMEIFRNANYNVLGYFLQANPLARVTRYSANQQGAFANNPDTMYLSTLFSLAYGQVLVIRGKKPSTPKTVEGNTYAASDVQTRYFSLTVGAGPVSGAGYSTVYDEQMPVDDNGYYTFAIGWPWNRPANATLSNKVVWMDAGAGEGYYVGARSWIGTAYFRFQNPSVGWENSPLNVPVPTTVDPVQHEQEIMGSYYPTCTYMSKVQFESTY